MKRSYFTAEEWDVKLSWILPPDLGALDDTALVAWHSLLQAAADTVLNHCETRGLVSVENGQVIVPFDVPEGRDVDSILSRAEISH